MQLRFPTPHIISTNREIVIDTTPHQMAKSRLVPSEDVPSDLQIEMSFVKLCFKSMIHFSKSNVLKLIFLCTPYLQIIKTP